MNALFAMSSGLRERFFTSSQADRLASVLNTAPGCIQSFAAADPAVLASLDLLITAWGAPPIDDTALASMPQLRAVIHAAGSVKNLLAHRGWERGIVVSSAAQANAYPVAEFTVAAILFAGKKVFQVSRAYGARQGPIDREVEFPGIGNYGRTVGIVGASRIGVRLIELLAPFDLRVLLYDPYVTQDRATELGVRATDLVDLARSSDILTIHAPWLPETEGMISAEILAALRDGSTVINTSRAALVDQEALLAELSSGRLNAVLDVTTPEVLPVGHPFYRLPNVFLTPHLAGSAGVELHRMGESATQEVERFAAGRPLQHQVYEHELSHLA